jgi:hypothetical protein
MNMAMSTAISAVTINGDDNSKWPVCSGLFSYSFLVVLRPNMRQIGQKLNTLVKTNIAARARRIIASVPEITLVK